MTHYILMNSCQPIKLHMEGKEGQMKQTKKTKYVAPKVVGSATVHPC